MPWYHIQIDSLDGSTVIYDLDPAIVARIPVDTSEIAPPATAMLPPTATSEPVAEPALVGVRVGAICRDGTRSSATGRGACSITAGWIIGCIGNDEQPEHRRSGCTGRAVEGSRLSSGIALKVPS